MFTLSDNLLKSLLDIDIYRYITYLLLTTVCKHLQTEETGCCTLGRGRCPILSFCLFVRLLFGFFFFFFKQFSSEEWTRKRGRASRGRLSAKGPRLWLKGVCSAGALCLTRVWYKILAAQRSWVFVIFFISWSSKCFQFGKHLDYRQASSAPGLFLDQHHLPEIRTAVPERSSSGWELLDELLSAFPDVQSTHQYWNSETIMFQRHKCPRYNHRCRILVLLLFSPEDSVFMFSIKFWSISPQNSFTLCFRQF